MLLKKLTSAEMITLTNPWCTHGHPERKLLESAPETRALLPRIEAAHDALVAASAPAADNKALDELIAEQHTLDDRHDNIVRGTFHVLTGFAFLARNARLGQGFLALRDFLLPEGVTLVNRSYREEAGQAKLLDERLGKERQKELKGIDTPLGTLADFVHEWIHTATQLGALEDKRVGMLDGTVPAKSDVGVARNAWIRAVNATVGLLELVETDAATKHKILARIEDTLKRAERRGAGGTDVGAGTTDAGAADAGATATPPVSKSSAANRPDPAAK